MTTPAGWYDDGRGAVRWWDGVQWTAHVQSPADLPRVPAIAGAAQPAVRADGVTWSDAPASPAGNGAFRVWLIGAAIGVVALIAAVALAVPAVVTAGQRIAQWDAGFDDDAWVPAAPAQGPAGETPSDGTVPTAMASDTVLAYDRAWQTGDCELYMATTTELFRAFLEVTSCASFAENSEWFTDYYAQYDVVVDDTIGGTSYATVETTETYWTSYDENGDDTGDLDEYAYPYTYRLVAVGGKWVIDSVV